MLFIPYCLHSGTEAIPTLPKAEPAIKLTQVEHPAGAVRGGLFPSPPDDPLFLSVVGG